ncbi:MAG TPA: long-chain-acyl-CoA synthetase [Beijerinckiaceae bacterium]|nr:long-chain-acyl-CoA synthetase [Beijerinckiaceae bacterium]
MSRSESEGPNIPAINQGSANATWLRALQATADIPKRPERTLPIVLGELSDRFGDAVALLSDRQSLSFRALARRAAHYAQWARAQDIEIGDAVCLLMPNCPDYLAIWLGIASVGGVVALLNASLGGPALAHCISVVAPKRIIVSADLVDRFESAERHLAASVPAWVHGVNARGLPRIDVEVGATRLGAARPRRPITLSDRALYIYTSGTTGLPKAAVVSHHRIMMWSYWFAGLLNTRPDDRMYDCLPLYHSVGGIVATGALLVNGGSVFIRDRFSARAFWSEVVDQKCTLFQYIGELCRYLLNAAPDPLETSHHIRICCGNGLRPEIWSAFKQRFAIPTILEFYAATEGNVSLYNVEGRPGSIGRLPPFSQQNAAFVLVKCESDQDEPLRDSLGFCVRCESGESGEAIGRIPAAEATRTGAFEGYSSDVETSRKILRDVFAKGDAWFRTGDLMRKDANGFYYFVDRLGDTFRWKGENVSTLEVSETLCACAGVLEAVVYGVTIPGADGRAGMAMLVAEDGIDLDALNGELAIRLPPYARPLFLRLRRTTEVTETFKYKKAPLVREGYDPDRVSDPLYYYDGEAQSYRRLDSACFGRILAGALRW